MRGSPASGHRKSRGFINLDGRKFGRVLVLGFARHDKDHRGYYRCKCNCGTVFVTRGDRLLAHRAKSCGCLQKEILIETGHRNKIHGLCGTSIYRIWSHIKQRCGNNTNPAFKYYGGRGIAVCNFIKQSSKNFLSVVGKRPPKRSIDRVNNDGGYTCGTCPQCVENGWPMNLRWATAIQQANNKRPRQPK